MLLLKKYADNFKDYAKREQEIVDVVITAIRGTKNPERVMLETKQGTFFAFTNSFPQGKVPVFNKQLAATVTLEENGEYINVVDVQYDTEQLGKFGLVATHGNAVVL